MIDEGGFTVMDNNVEGKVGTTILIPSIYKVHSSGKKEDGVEIGVTP